MPFDSFHIHSHSRSSSSQQNVAHGGAATGIIQAAQNLGSFGLPALSSAAGQATPATTTHGPNSTMTSTSNNATMNQPQQYETPRRMRHPDEAQTNMSSQRGPLSPRDYGQGGPRIKPEELTPEPSQYPNTAQLPGTLQSGRPSAISAHTAPAVPTMPQDQYSTPSRTSNMGLSHNYTRSSPAGFDGQSYGQFQATTPGGTEQSQFSSPSQKYTPQPSQRTVSNTPLGLADIRPRGDSGLSDGLPGANPYSYDGASATPTNSNYLAPWALYAFDWCKWPAQNNEAGKVAIGSYLEDGHNFVS
jgi:WD repeat-containing protein 68